MSFLPDSSWLNALKLPTQVMIGLFIACNILLFIDHKEIFELKLFGELAKPIIVIITIFSGSLSLTGIISFAKDYFANRKKQTLIKERRKQKEIKKENDKIQGQTNIIGRLDHLSPKEIHYLAKCLRENSQSFYTYVHSPPVTTLMGKALVHTPGGSHHQDHYPFTIYDFVWTELLKRKKEFIEKDDLNKQEEQKNKQRGRRH